MKKAKTLENKIKQGRVMPDGTTAVKLSSKHASLIKHKKQIMAETLRLERKKLISM